MRPTRRDFLKLLLATSIAEAVDVEKLLWTPKPIITVPAGPICFKGVPFEWDTLDVTRVDVYDYYHYSWKIIGGRSGRTYRLTDFEKEIARSPARLSIGGDDRCRTINLDAKVDDRRPRDGGLRSPQHRGSRS